MSARFAIEALTKRHPRKTFACVNERIDRYFRETVTQDAKRRYASCFVAGDRERNCVAGFYTLSSSNVPLMAVPEPLVSRRDDLADRRGQRRWPLAPYTCSTKAR